MLRLLRILDKNKHISEVRFSELKDENEFYRLKILVWDENNNLQINHHMTYLELRGVVKTITEYINSLHIQVTSTLNKPSYLGQGQAEVMSRKNSAEAHLKVWCDENNHAWHFNFPITE